MTSFFTIVSRYFWAIRYLKPQQIYFRLYYKFYKPKVTSLVHLDRRAIANDFIQVNWRSQSYLGSGNFTFLNKRNKVCLKTWRCDEPSLLWKYNLHYFDFIHTNQSADSNNELIYSWINAHNVGDSPAFDPYPTSLRIVNWIKWSLVSDYCKRDFLDSLQRQGDLLERRLEFDLRANHLLANAKALVFLGVFFCGKKADGWLAQGTRVLSRELDEQILDDGGHFELSPMYHAIILEDLLDIINLSRISAPALPAELQHVIEKIRLLIPKMFVWLEKMSHPDGGVSYFNDSSQQIAMPLLQLNKYANALGFIAPIYSADAGDEVAGGNDLSLCHLEDSGYVVVQSNKFKLFIDLSNCGPAYQMGHAHADPLSFELSIGKQRVLVNTGTSTYDRIKRRAYERSTAAHNTVSLERRNAIDVWSSFRVGRRGVVSDVSVSNHNGDSVAVSASFTGFSNWFHSTKITRTWNVTEDGIQIIDMIYNANMPSIANVHFHPDVLVDAEDASVFSIFDKYGARIGCMTTDNECDLAEYQYAKSFGALVPGTKVALRPNHIGCIMNEIILVPS